MVEFIPTDVITLAELIERYVEEGASFVEATQRALEDMENREQMVFVHESCLDGG
jgi:hypothetical protein